MANKITIVYNETWSVAYLRQLLYTQSNYGEPAPSEESTLPHAVIQQMKHGFEIIIGVECGDQVTWWICSDHTYTYNIYLYYS